MRLQEINTISHAGSGITGSFVVYPEIAEIHTKGNLRGIRSKLWTLEIVNSAQGIGAELFVIYATV
jgi:hypothetical protein